MLRILVINLNLNYCSTASQLYVSDVTRNKVINREISFSKLCFRLCNFYECTKPVKIINDINMVTMQHLYMRQLGWITE